MQVSNIPFFIGTLKLPFIWLMLKPVESSTKLGVYGSIFVIEQIWDLGSAPFVPNYRNNVYRKAKITPQESRRPWEALAPATSTAVGRRITHPMAGLATVRTTGCSLRDTSG